MIRCRLVCLIASVLLLSIACRQAQEIQIKPNPPDEASLTFDIEPLHGQVESQLWRGIYVSRGRTARFRIQLGAAKPIPGRADSGFNFKFGEGQLLPEPESDSSVLLTDLQKV